MTVFEIMNANIDAVRAVINEMDDKFDSHDFIKKFSGEIELDYVNLLATARTATPFQTVHSQIGRFLRNNEDNLNIRYVEDVNSENIFGNVTECASWRKI
ncbi:MAG: hypothetical protein WC984_01060 [Bacteroidales bacterium]